MISKLRYAERGVSSNKEDVHKAISKLDKGIFPNAFCKILPDYAGGDPEYCNIIHTDTAGTKTSLAYIYWKETGDLSVWKGIAQDAIVMNIDDMACVGCVDNFVLSSNIARNKKYIPGEVIQAIIEGTEEFCEKLRKLGINIYFGGGETADVGDIVRTVDVGITAFARMKKKDIIECNIQDGDKIIGFASYGQTNYENEYNSGIGCNGLTSARHDLLHKSYAKKYQESFDPDIPKELVYCGPYKVTDLVEGLPINIGKALLSPTRTYLPVIKTILEKSRKNIHAIIHNTGGGLTKVMKFAKNMEIKKNNLLPIPPIFKIIQETSQTSLQEMYKVFNLGCRLELYYSIGQKENDDDTLNIFNIESQTIGVALQAEKTTLIIK